MIDRTVLASILNNDQDLIIKFETLFYEVEKKLPDAVSILFESQKTTKENLIEQLDRTANALESLPVAVQRERNHDLSPASILMSMNDDLAPRNIREI